VELTVIIPVLNEAGNIPSLYERLSEVMQALGKPYELLFVNDGSTDATLALVRELRDADPRVQFIDFSRNFGHQIAVSAGINYARGRHVVIIDADLQDPPELIHQLYAKLLEGNEVVYARRRKRKGETFFKRWTARLFYRFFNQFSSINIPLDTGDFRIIAQPVVQALRQMPEQHKFIRGQISWIGFRQTYIEYDRDPRLAGESHYPLRKMVRFALDGLTGFSVLPLKLATLLGFLVSGAAFLFIIIIIMLRLFGTQFGILTQPGWSSQMVVTLFLGGIQLITIGILGEYIGRIADNSKARPLYIVRTTSPELQLEATRSIPPA
jgi:polyisoprenyl-phosphate glycosyltransferase